MYILDFIENKFNSFSIKTKLELTILPIIIIFLIWILFFKELSSKKISSTNHFSIDSIKLNHNYLEIIRDIEEYLLQNKLKDSLVENLEDRIKIQINTTENKELMLINYLENYNNFSNIVYIKKHNNKLILEISFNKIFVKKPFVINKKIDIVQEDAKNYKLLAIVKDRAFINNKWVSKNSKLNGLILKKVSNDFIILSNGLENKKVSLYKNE